MHTMAVESERRIVLQNVSWDTYEGLLSARGDSPAPRFAFDRGNLEIMSPSVKHEWLKSLIGRLIEAYTEERGIRIKSVGATTLKSQLKAKGLEPDESYYIQNEALVRGREDLDLSTVPPPDLAVEIDVSTSSLDKLEIYSALGVSEVWTYDDGLVMYHLKKTVEPFVAQRSKALPELAGGDLNRFLHMRATVDETSLVRAFRAWVREQHGTG